MNIKFRLAFLLTLLAVTFTARAQPAHDQHVEAQLIAENLALTPGQNWVALRIKPDAGWHTYWRNPGDTGIPTQLNWNLPEGVSAGAIQWPYPQLHKLGDLAYFGYGDETLHLVQITVPAQLSGSKSLTLGAEAKWLVCADVCIPGKQQVSLTLPVSASTSADSVSRSIRWPRISSASESSPWTPAQPSGKSAMPT